MSREIIQSVNELEPTGLNLDYGQNLNTIGGGQIDGGFGGGGFDWQNALGGGVEGLATAGLDSATGGLFSTVSGGLTALTGVDVFAEFDKVKEFGLSSWGASTDPTKELADMQRHVIPIVEDKMRSINGSNIEAVLSWLDGFFMFTHIGYKHLREHHAKAGSTKVAYDKTMIKVLELKKKFVDDIVSGLKSKSFKVSKTTKTVDHNALESVYTWHTGGKFDSVHKYNVRVSSYAITAPKISQTTATSNNTGILADDGKPSEAGSGGILGVLSILAIGYKLLKG